MFITIGCYSTGHQQRTIVLTRKSRGSYLAIGWLTGEVDCQPGLPGRDLNYNKDDCN